MINIITIHCQTNFGSVFQAYALHKFLLNKNYDNELIDYRPDYIVKQNNNLVKKIRHLIFYKNEKKVRAKYDKFIKSNILLTKHCYHCYKDLMQNPPHADIYISGSDQLWNPNYKCGEDNSYKLKFIKNGLKMSYATSIGTTDVTDEDISKLAKDIFDYTFISVRENSSVPLLENKLEKDIKCVSDPVYLLDSSIYMQMVNENEYGDYVLVYLVDKSKLVDETVKIIKEHYKCKVIFVSGVTPKCECDLHIKDAGPIDMLSLIFHAKAIVTSSFHATSFSLIFKKDFYPITSIKNNERLINILTIAGFEKKAIFELEDLKNIDYVFNYEEASKRINEYSTLSKQWLINKLDILIESSIKKHDNF